MSLDEVTSRMERLVKDRSVPNNVRRMLSEAVETLEDGDKDLSVRINTATSLLDEISNDPNIAQYTRTEIWNIASLIESLKE